MKILIVTLLSAPFLASAIGHHPDNPEPGKCYQKVVTPAKYKTYREKVLEKPEGFTIKTIPAKYEMVSESVVVQEASEKSVIIPAKYKWIKERVMVEDEKRILNPIPAKYKTVAKKVMVQPERYAWKKGKGPNQRVNSAGEIMCYTKIPAVYNTIRERVLVSEASVDEKIIPARYSTVKKRVLDEPERIIKQKKPEVRKTIKVRKMTEEPREMQVKVPARYGYIDKKEQISPASSRWSSILCKTNATPAKVRQVQKALKAAGHYRGPIDGILGKATMSGASSYQRSQGLAYGGLTEETLGKLGISL